MIPRSTWIIGVALVAACSSPDVEDTPPPRRSPRASGAVRTPAKAVRAERQDLGQGPLVIPRAALDKVLAAGPGWLLSKVPLEPVRGTDRKFLGFKIISVFDGSPTAERFGVRPGDLLMQVQRQRIVTPGDLLTVFQRAKGASEIAVELLRDGKPVSLRWPVVDPGQALPGTASPGVAEPLQPEREQLEP